MRKILLVLVSVLLLAGIAQAAEYTQAIGADYTAQNTGRSRTTESSVLLQLWSTGSLTNPGVGVSDSTTIIVYNNTVTQVGYTIDTAAAAYDTVGEVVDYINTNFASDSSVRISAAVGPDAYRDLPTTELNTANIAALGITRADAGTVTDAGSRRISAGVQDNTGVTPRIKSISCALPSNVANNTTLTVYDGNTAIWRKIIGPGAYNSATADSSSANTVVFPEAKGISATKGNSIVAVATTDANINGDAWGIATNQISIVYDNLRD